MRFHPAGHPGQTDAARQRPDDIAEKGDQRDEQRGATQRPPQHWAFHHECPVDEHDAHEGKDQRGERGEEAF